jgi:1-acyl-sn-glycerol-3-phosphate acyltransferase
VALKQAFDLLAQGRALVIFPEGRLNPENRPVKTGNGAIRMSLVSGAPIIPLGFYVPEDHLYELVLPKGGRKAHGRIQTGGICYIQIGSPWLPSQEIQGKVVEPVVQALTTRLMEKINALTHQAYLASIQDNLKHISGVSVGR